MNPIEFILTDFSTKSGDVRPALIVSWLEVERILGHEHEGTSDDDAFLLSALRDAGAPEWIEGAEGFTDTEGWGLMGPDPDREDS